jgi:hypothetical protein
MIKLKDDSNIKAEDTIIPMRDLMPLQAGVIFSDIHYAAGSLVIRTASEEKFEVISLSNPKPGSCWQNPNIHDKVRLLRPGETYTLEIS